MKAQLGKCKDDLFLIVPKEDVARLGWESGDIVEIEVSGGELKAVLTMTAHDHAMEIARRVMEEYRETFEALAKT